MRHQVLGEPGVDLLVGEDGLPGGLVADVVAELEALGHELLGLDLALVAGQAGPCRGNKSAGRSGRARPGRDGDDDAQDDPGGERAACTSSLRIREPIESGRDRVMGNDPLAVERNRDADWEDLTWTRGRTIEQHTTAPERRSTRTSGQQLATGCHGAARATGQSGRAAVSDLPET